MLLKCSVCVVWWQRYQDPLTEECIHDTLLWLLEMQLGYMIHVRQHMPVIQFTGSRRVHIAKYITRFV